MAVSVVQDNEFLVPTATGTWDFAFLSAVTPGNVVVIAARLGTNNRVPTTPTGGGGTFALIQSIGGTSLGNLRLWSVLESNSGNTNYPITINNNLGAASTGVGVVQGWELAGCDSATPTASGTGTQATTTSPRMLDTGLDIASGGIMIGGISTQGSLSVGTWTTPNNFTSAYQSVSVPGASVLFAQSLTAGTAVQGVATVTTGRAVWGLAATWIEAAAGGGPFPHFIRRRMFGGMTFPRGGI
jgi:hypothetical protein